MHKDVKTKYHSTVVNGFDVHVGPHTISKKSFMVSPPIKIRAVAVPADRYAVGKIDSHAPNRFP